MSAPLNPIGPRGLRIEVARRGRHRPHPRGHPPRHRARGRPLPVGARPRHLGGRRRRGEPREPGREGPQGDDRGRHGDGPARLPPGRAGRGPRPPARWRARLRRHRRLRRRGVRSRDRRASPVPPLRTSPRSPALRTPSTRSRSTGSPSPRRTGRLRRAHSTNCWPAGRTARSTSRPNRSSPSARRAPRWRWPPRSWAAARPSAARPVLSMMQCTTSPLGHDGGSIDAGLVAAEAGIPVGYMTMASAAFTGPATVAGSLVVGNAEVVAALALMQIAYPGCPVYYAAAQTAIDLRSGAYTGGGPEDFLFGAATNQLADFYHVPLSMGAFATGAKAPDWQAGVENSLSTFLASAVWVGHAPGPRAPQREPDLLPRAAPARRRDLLDRAGDAEGDPRHGRGRSRSTRSPRSGRPATTSPRHTRAPHARAVEAAVHGSPPDGRRGGRRTAGRAPGRTRRRASSSRPTSPSRSSRVSPARWRPVVSAVEREAGVEPAPTVVDDRSPRAPAGEPEPGSAPLRPELRLLGADLVGRILDEAYELLRTGRPGPGRGGDGAPRRGRRRRRGRGRPHPRPRSSRGALATVPALLRPVRPGRQPRRPLRRGRRPVRPGLVAASTCWTRSRATTARPSPPTSSASSRSPRCSRPTRPSPRRSSAATSRPRSATSTGSSSSCSTRPSRSSPAPSAPKDRRR